MDQGARILAGRYEVGELIGRGGMAEVHIGHDTRLGRTVAVKILRSDLARDPSFQARFRREAQAAASLNHPAVVAVYDTGEDLVTGPGGAVAHVPFIVMEYVEGHTVRDILRDGHAVPIEEAVEIATGVLSALEYSHHAGIVHRDIKPANVMLTPTGAVKVMDFGIARAVADSAATMTQTQAVIGTAQYLSPEQARGESVDARSDLYSTGCLLFELLTGRPPFQGDSPVAVAYQHVRELPPVPSSLARDIPETLDRITLKALSKDREDRYPTAAEFRSDLETAVRGGVVGAPPVATALAARPREDATTVLPPAAATTAALPAAAPAWAGTGAAASAPTTAVTPAVADPPRRRTGLVVLLVLVGLAAVAGIIALLVNDARSTPDEVVVPPVAGLTVEAATDALTALELEVRTAQAPSDTVEEGLVVGSDPAEGESAAVGDTVTLTVSTGAANVTVPDVSGESEARATQILEGEGLVVVEDRQPDNSPDFAAGEVTRTDPAADAQVPDGQSVTLFVATGNVELVDLRGQTVDEAVQALTALNLRPVTTEVETADAEPGRVVSQDLSPGLVRQQTAVTLEIATAPTTATVPDDLVGLPYDEAAAAITAAGLEPQRVDAPSQNQPAGAVVSVNPTSGLVVARGTAVTVTVSTGAGTPAPTPSPSEGGDGEGGGD
nr:Stk1 family PASTA domain-containing Ser/Thr kinase [Cellulomonas endophytica]